MDFKVNDQNMMGSFFRGFPVLRLMAPVTGPFRALSSKRAQRAYLATLLFTGMSLFLLCAAPVAYWIFYYNFIPQIGVERVVHLQFGDGDPWGTAMLGSELVSLQPYDVSVTLQLPRSQSNLAMGNFMLDLTLFSRSAGYPGAGSNVSTHLIARSRRPAILTYASPIVETTRRISRMPLYLIGWQRESESLQVSMMESVQFARGWRNLPGSLRFEVQARAQMEVYNVAVKFKAKFTGLRWIMRTWWLLSFFVLTSMFWGVSMMSTGFAWLLFSSYLDTSRKESSDQAGAEGSENVQVKAEDKELLKPAFSEISSSNQHGSLGILRQAPSGSLRHTRREEKTLEGKISEATDSESVSSEADEANPEDEDDTKVKKESHADSIFRSSHDSLSPGRVQRRRSHRFSDHEHHQGD